MGGGETTSTLEVSDGRAMGVQPVTRGLSFASRGFRDAVYIFLSAYVGAHMMMLT